MDAKGYNDHGVLMCECKPYGPAHAYEPGECSPVHVMPLEAQKLAAEQQRDRLLEAISSHKGEWDEMYWDKSPDRRTEKLLAAVWDGDQKLYETAQEIEGERDA